MVLTIGDVVGVLFTWSVHISKSGNLHKYSQKRKEKKKNRHDVTIFDNVGVVFRWSAHISKYHN